MSGNRCSEINLQEWNRAELFSEFIGMTTSIYDMTVRMDVSRLVDHCREYQAILLHQLSVSGFEGTECYSRIQDESA